MAVMLKEATGKMLLACFAYILGAAIAIYAVVWFLRLLPWS